MVTTSSSSSFTSTLCVPMHVWVPVIGVTLDVVPWGQDACAVLLWDVSLFTVLLLWTIQTSS